MGQSIPPACALVNLSFQGVCVILLRGNSLKLNHEDTKAQRTISVTVQPPLYLPRIARIHTKKAKKLVKIRVIRGKKELEAGASRVVPGRLPIRA